MDEPNQKISVVLKQKEINKFYKTEFLSVLIPELIALPIILFFIPSWTVRLMILLLVLILSPIFLILLSRDIVASFQIKIDENGIYYQNKEFLISKPKFVSWKENNILQLAFGIWKYSFLGSRIIVSPKDRHLPISLCIPKRSIIENIEEVEAILEKVPKSKLADFLRK